MANIKVSALLLAGVVSAMFGCGTKTNTSDSAPTAESGHIEPIEDREDESNVLYTVAEYDPIADPSKDLTTTVSRASQAGKRILLEIGGQW